MFGPVFNIGKHKGRNCFLVQRLGQIQKQPFVGRQINIGVILAAQILHRDKKLLKQNSKLFGIFNSHHALVLNQLRDIDIVQLFNHAVNLSRFNRVFQSRQSRQLSGFNQILNILIQFNEIIGKFIEMGKLAAVMRKQKRVGNQTGTQFFNSIFNGFRCNFFTQNSKIAVA